MMSTASTTRATEARPQRLQADNLILEELQDELMVYDPDRNKAFCLNQTAAFVWKQSDGKTTVSEIAEHMQQQLKKPVNEQMVWFALDMLSKDGLLVPSTIASAVPSGVTRRQLLQKLGAGAMALPVVTVLFVSPVKAHASSLAPTPTPTPTPDEIDPAAHRQGGFWAWLEGLF
jgi:hypothetical protein